MDLIIGIISTVCFETAFNERKQCTELCAKSLYKDAKLLILAHINRNLLSNRTYFKAHCNVPKS